MNKEFEKLEKALKGLTKPSVDVNMKERIKSDVLKQITQYKTDPASQNETGFLPASLIRLREKVRRLAKFVEPSHVMRAKVKEKVLSFVESASRSHTFLRNFIHSWQKVTASVLVLLIIFTSFTVYISDIPVTQAARSTIFQEVFGVVQIIRGDDIFDAYEGMDIEQGDVVITGENGMAMIRYVDDSVTRLSPESEIRINKLYQDIKDKTKTNIEVELTKGRIWSQVINLVDNDSSFQVQTNDIKAITSNKASFDIKNTNDDNVTVSVFENKVEVSLPDNKKDKIQLLLQGYSLEVDKKGPKTDNIILNESTNEDELWVQINKAKDKEYKKEKVEQTENEKKAEAGLLSENPLYTAKKINETTKLLITTNEDDKTILKVEIAVKRLAEASTLLAEGKEESAYLALDEFNSIIDEISGSVENSDELINKVNTLFREESKDLSVILPDSNLYPVKEALRDAKKILAISTKDKKETALESASEKLIEAKELFEEDKDEIAVETLEKVKEEVREASAQPDDDADQETDEEMIDSHVETLTSATVLNEAVKGDNKATRELKTLAEDTEEIFTEELEDAVSDANIDVSVEVLEKADTILEIIDEEVDIIIEIIPGETDIAVIMPVLLEGQE